MMDIKWKNITPTQFEQLCCELLLANGFANVRWHGATGSDKGRDIVCTKAESILPGSLKARTWVVQCKRLVASGITKAVIAEWLAACEEHKPDNVLLILTRVLSSNMKDWLKGVAHKYSFGINLWEEDELRRQILKHCTKLRRQFPQLVKGGKHVLFYKLAMGEMQLGCNDIDEAYITLMNVDTYKQAVEKAREFVDFIKANDIVFARKG